MINTWVSGWVRGCFVAYCGSCLNCFNKFKFMTIIYIFVCIFNRGEYVSVGITYALRNFLSNICICVEIRPFLGQRTTTDQNPWITLMKQFSLSTIFHMVVDTTKVPKIHWHINIDKEVLITQATQIARPPPLTTCRSRVRGSGRSHLRPHDDWSSLVHFEEREHARGRNVLKMTIWIESGTSVLTSPRDRIAVRV